MGKKRVQGQFKFNIHDSIGSADAEDDKFLIDCFVDKGEIEILRDCLDSRSIVVGRTGSGKTALIKYFRTHEERVIDIPPESLSLSYISNSTILRFVADLGVNLDIFYKLLWRHVFTVELIKKHFDIISENDKRTFFQRIKDLFKDQKEQKALEYLEKWGSHFWEDTDYRIKEVTDKLEKDVSASIGVDAKVFKLDSAYSSKITEEQKGEIIKRAQVVVNSVQIRELSYIIGLIDQILDDELKKYYIVIDRLDEDWVEDRLRYQLIRALIDTVKDFNRIKHAKIIICIRQDLLDRVFRKIRASGYQEEKYESRYLPIRWDKYDLIQIMDKRLNYLIRSRYTSQRLNMNDLFPEKIDGENSIDFILNRTMMHPRDVIHFVNQCIQNAAGKKGFTVETLKTAEGEYSRNRLRFLADEWSADYPNLIDFVDILKKKPAHFPIGDLKPQEIEDFCLVLVSKRNERFEKSDFLSQSAIEIANSTLTAESFTTQLFQIFYHVGVIGLKFETFDTFLWCFGNKKNISFSEINERTKVSIHPAFWRVLGTISR